MNFPLGHPWPPLPGHGRGNHPFFHVRRHAGRKRLETAPKGHSKSGRKAARSSDRRWAIVCLGGQPGFLRPCLEAENVHVRLLFFPLPSLPLGAVNAARGWCAHGGGAALRGFAACARTAFFLAGFCPVWFCLGGVGYLGCGGWMWPQGCSGRADVFWAAWAPRCCNP